MTGRQADREPIRMTLQLVVWKDKGVGTRGQGLLEAANGERKFLERLQTQFSTVGRQLWCPMWKLWVLWGFGGSK